MPFVHLSGNGDFDHVRLLGVAVRAIAETALAPSDAAQLEIAVVEACNNIVEHAYANTKGIITVDIFLTDQKFVVNLRDTGKAMVDAHQIKDSTALDFDIDNLDDLPEGGFGMFLMDTIVDERKYFSENGINTLTLTKYIQP
ncbi:MAG: ATP-binding protein [Candidatus Kapabacteria bacterium]|jgi:serine/threonine-protein kinase RsbW|nr:ATP-binding protein [Candidatus Kapabacteria bacterium]